LMRLKLQKQLLEVVKVQNFHEYPLYILVDETISVAERRVNYHDVKNMDDFNQLETLWEDIRNQGTSRQIQDFVDNLEGKGWYTYPNPMLPIPVIGEK